MAFTRTPVDGSPATYTGTDLVDTLTLADQASEITISGLDADDVIIVSGAALSANALSAFKIYGNDDDDTISVSAAQLSGSTVQGGSGDDTLNFTATATAVSSVVRGGADDDTITVQSLNSATVNGNKGIDTITVNGNALNSRVYGGSENDTININAQNSTLTRYNGSKGADTLNILNTAILTRGSVFGGEGNDNIQVVTSAGAAGTIASSVYLSGDKGNDTITVASTVGGDVLGGEGNDNISVTGTAATDAYAVTGGLGADTITIGTGTDTITFNRGDSLSETASQLGGTLGTNTTLQTTDSVTFGNGVDTISGFTTGTDIIDIDMAVPAAITVLDGAALTTNMASTGIQVFGGTLAGNTFTFAATVAAANDFLYIVGGGNQTVASGLVNSDNIFISDNILAITDFA